MNRVKKYYFFILIIIQGHIINAQTLSFTDVAIPSWIFYGEDPGHSVAWGDYDNDNDIDLYVVKTTGGNTKNYLFRNDVNTAGRFYEVATQLGIDEASANSWAAAWCDINNDNLLDLYVCNLSDYMFSIENKLFVNNGMTFDDQSTNYNASIFGQNRALCWGDYDNDGDQDLFLTLNNVVGIQEAKLLRNDGNYFTDVTNLYNIITEPYNSSKAQWVDFDNDNDLDLYINISTLYDNRFYENRINENNMFIDISSTYAIDDSGDASWSLWFDYDNDADLDLFLSGREIRFYRNDLNLINDFTDVTTNLGIPLNLAPDHFTTGDYDLDGDLDLYIANAYDPNSFFRNDINSTGIFVEIGDSLGVNDSNAGLATVSGDYDNDGDLDIFVLNGGNPEFNNLYRNEIISSNYLFIRPTDVNGCYNRFGSKVKVYYAGTNSLVGMRVVDGGGNGGLSQNQYDCHFGLDDSLAYDIEVIFTTRTNGQNHIFNKHNRPELGNYIPSQHGYFLEVRDSVITVTSLYPKKEQDVITDFKMYQNYPNPFNATTVIPIQLENSYHVKLTIYDLKGKEVRSFDKGYLPNGYYKVTWNSKNGAGNGVASGVYLSSLYLDNQLQDVKKIILLR